MSVMANFKYKSEDKQEARIRLIFPRDVDITEETVRKSLFTSGRSSKWFFVIIKLLLSVAEVGGFLGMILGVSLMDLEMLFKKILLLVKSKRFSDNIWLISHLNNIIYAPSYTITTVVELLRCLEQTNFVKILLNLNISQVRSETGWEPKLAKYNCTFCVEI